MVSEFHPRSYHVTNVALHVLATGLFAVFARTLTPHARLARTAAPLLFAAHPIHTEAVAGVVGRADVGAAIFFLGALLSYMRYCGCGRGNGFSLGVATGGKVGRRAWLGAALVSATLSMLTKEHGITALAVCAAYHLFVYAKLRPREVFSVLTDVSTIIFLFFFPSYSPSVYLVTVPPMISPPCAFLSMTTPHSPLHSHCLS